MESLGKELTATKMELDEEKERSTNLAQRLKDLEIQHVTAVGRRCQEKVYSKFCLDKRTE